jgi:hypothetical protein
MRELEISVDLDALRTHLRGMNDSELLAFGNQMHHRVYLLTYDGTANRAFRHSRFGLTKRGMNGGQGIRRPRNSRLAPKERLEWLPSNLETAFSSKIAQVRL